MVLGGCGLTTVLRPEQHLKVVGVGEEDGAGAYYPPV